MVIGITGATGLLGNELCNFLVTKSLDIINYVRKTPTNSINTIKYIEGDILDLEDLENFVQACDLIVHCAAKVSFDQRDQDEIYQVNVIGTKTLVDILISYPEKKLIYISSVAALGRKSNKIIDENTLWNEGISHTIYAKSKYLAELEVHRAATEGLKAMILYPSIILSSPIIKRSSAMLWQQIKNMGKWAPAGSNGFVCVEDVVQAIFQCINEFETNKKYIISAENLSFQQLYAFAQQKKFSSIKILSKKFLLRLRPLVNFYYFLNGNKSRITTQNIHSTSNQYLYDNRRSKEELKLNYHSIEEKAIQCMQDLEK